jgi:hypothetical protein
MMEIKPTWIGLLAALPLSAIAHHGCSEYDVTRALTLTGTVVESGWEHPHGFVKLATPGKTWIVVPAPPSRVENRGLQKAEIASGMTATVEGFPNRDKPEEMRAERIAVGGKTTELR